jgi:hypothetical protein
MVLSFLFIPAKLTAASSPSGIALVPAAVFRRLVDEAEKRSVQSSVRCERTPGKQVFTTTRTAGGGDCSKW